MSALSPINGPLSRRAASHLLKRLTFGPTRKEINNLENKSISQALDILFQKHEHPQPPLDTATGKQWVNPIPTEGRIGRVNSLETTLIPYMRQWWLDTMCKQNTGITEKMVFFYHSHFTTLQSRIYYSLSLYYQLSLFRHHSTGNVKELARKMCLDNAMLINLDGNLNEMGNVNENFAREFLELYTIGKGPQVSATDYTNYTEQDIKEAARIFTGFKTEHTFSQNLDPETGVPLCRMIKSPQNQATRHDAGEKKFSHRFGNRTIKPNELITYHTLQDLASVDAAHQEVQELVDMIFEQKETARQFCRKLYRFFVYYKITPEIESSIIDPLADTLINNNYETEPVLRQLFSSQHFFDQGVTNEATRVQASLIKSPLDVMAGTLRFFGVSLPDRTQLPLYYDLYKELLQKLAQQGLDLYEPYDVAGYTAYHQAPDYNRNWISSNFLARRYQFADDMLNGIKNKSMVDMMKLDVLQYVRNPLNISNPADATKMVGEFIEDLFPHEISENRFSYFLNNILLDNLSTKNWEMEWQKYLESGNDASVRLQLEKLIRALLQAPEYQLL